MSKDKFVFNCTHVKALNTKHNKRLRKDGTLCLTNRGRLVYALEENDQPAICIDISLDEMSEILKQARAFSRSKLHKKYPHLGYYKHLSPDVAFLFNNRRKRRKKK